MREILYKYNHRGLYQTEDDTAFGEDPHLKIIIEPHDFSIALGDEVLRSSFCSGYTAIVSRDGEVVFYDNENKIIGGVEKSENCYNNVHLEWKQDSISIQFGDVAVVDYYPNCDGEYDRWGKEWVTQRAVTLDLKNISIEIR